MVFDFYPNLLRAASDCLVIIVRIFDAGIIGLGFVRQSDSNSTSSRRCWLGSRCHWKYDGSFFKRYFSFIQKLSVVNPITHGRERYPNQAMAILLRQKYDDRSISLEVLQKVWSNVFLILVELREFHPHTIYGKHPESSLTIWLHWGFWHRSSSEKIKVKVGVSS